MQIFDKKLVRNYNSLTLTVPKVGGDSGMLAMRSTSPPHRWYTETYMYFVPQAVLGPTSP